MKRRFFVVLFAVVAFACLALGLTACSGGNSPSGGAHSHDMEHYSAVAATCTESGNIEYWYCEGCDKYFSDAEGEEEIIDKSSITIAATEHSWTEWETIEEATCTEDGLKEHECTICHTNEQETITKTGHSYSENWSHDETYHWLACLNCGEIEDKAEHTLDEGVVTTQPTCAEDGIMTYTCTVCNAAMTATIPATGHTYSEDWSSDETYHWHAAMCEHTSEIGGKAEHIFVDDVCSVCGRKAELAFKLSADGTYYIVMGVGTVSKSDISIPSTYNNLPVKAISNGAFSRCTSLTSIAIPSSVTSIDENAFYNCSSLEAVYITDIAAWCAIDFGDSDSNPLIYAGNLYLNNQLITNLIIPESVTEISDYAFFGCDSITSLMIEGEMIAIGNYAFHNCNLLSQLSVNCNESTIGDYAFYDCNLLSQLSVNCNESTIGDYAFYSCDALKVVVIDEASIIGNYAFFGCGNLNAITIPSSTVEIGVSAFEDCVSLGTLTLEGNSRLETISSSAFNNCNLTSLSLPESIVHIGSRAFYMNESLSRITLPDKPIHIGEDAFVRTAYYNSESNWDTSDGNNRVLYIGYHMIEGFGSSYNYRASYTVREGTLDIADGVYNNVYGLTGVTLPDSVVIIGNAFVDCRSLLTVTIPKSVTELGTLAFSGYYFQNITVAEDNPVYHSAGRCVIETATKTLVRGVSGCSIPDDGSVIAIGESAFEGSNITSITIPDDIISIGNRAFYECTRLTSVTMYGSPEHIGDHAFAFCSRLRNINLGNTVISIGEEAFIGCSALTYIVIPDSLQTVENSAFDMCNALSAVYYQGTETEWSNIVIDQYNDWLTNATIYYYSESQTTDEGNYWHYDMDGITPVIWTKDSTEA